MPYKKSYRKLSFDCDYLGCIVKQNYLRGHIFQILQIGSYKCFLHRLDFRLYNLNLSSFHRPIGLHKSSEKQCCFSES